MTTLAIPAPNAVADVHGLCGQIEAAATIDDEAADIEIKRENAAAVLAELRIAEDRHAQHCAVPGASGSMRVLDAAKFIAEAGAA